MTANPGGPGSGTVPSNMAGGPGGSAGGGNSNNTAGNPGGNGASSLGSGSPVTSGAGGNAPFGGSGGVGVSSIPDHNGNPGGDPGAGGSGGGHYTGGFSGTNFGLPGGGSGGFCQSVFTRGSTPGAPAVGSLISCTVGVAVAGGDGTTVDGGNSAGGRIEFIWTDPPAPTVTNVAPDHGSPAGGDTITITGNNFLGANSVKFGGTEWTTGGVVSDTTLQGITPAHSSGLVDVTVTTPFGTGTGTNVFRYDTSGTLAATEASDIAAFNMLRSAFGTLNVTEATDISAFTGSLNVFGSLATTEAPDTTLIRQQFFDDTDEFVLGGGFPLGAFGEDIEGVFFQISDDPDVLAFAGLVEWRLVLNTTEAPDVVDIHITVHVTIVLNTTEAPDIAAFNMIAQHLLTLDATEAPDVIMITGSTISNVEVEYVVGQAAMAELTGIAILPTLTGNARDYDIDGVAGQILIGRANRATLAGRETIT